MNELRIEEGKFYRTRRGEKIGPMINTKSPSSLPWTSAQEAHRAWHADGRRYERAFTPQDDLVAEWSSDGPIRTVYRKEIVPGTYGVVSVSSPLDASVIVKLGEMGGLIRLGPNDLRAAAATFIEIADALDSPSLTEAGRTG